MALINANVVSEGLMASRFGRWLLRTERLNLGCRTTVIVALATIFVADFTTPADLMIESLYIPAVLTVLVLRSPQWLWGVIAASVILTIAAAFGTPLTAEGTGWVIWLNRTFVIIVLVAFGSVIHWPRGQRRLVAILAADIVGYSRLMSEDELGTLSRLKTLRREIITPITAAHSGRIVNLLGDGALVEFASVVDAVTSAIGIQKQVREHKVGGTGANSIQFRVGIHLGDVIIDGDDIYGDGVNIAARLEGIADPGSIFISDDALRQVRGKVKANFVDLGNQTLKNITNPMRVYRVETGAQTTIAPVA